MSGLLADIFVAGDRAKKRVRGLLTDPVAQVQQNADNWAADTLEAMQTPEGMASQLIGSGLLGKIVWHGSPHRFIKFDSSKIGTGEGAQAYGHGLYLADLPDVARQYIPDKEALHRNSMYMKRALARGDGGYGPIDDDLRALYKEKLPEVKNALRNASLYKVDLPDSAIARMLDWDKPLSQQAPEVQKAVLSIDPGQQLSARGAAAYGDIRGLFDNAVNPPSVSMAEASKRLREAGIPGIRYLDGGSRGVGAGTSNYVVFPGNEDILRILEINGQPFKGLLGM